MDIEITIFYARLGAIVLIMTLGFLLGKLKLISDKTNRELTNLLLTVFMPASLFMAFPPSYDEASASLFFSGLAGGAIVMLSIIILAKIIFNKKWIGKGLRPLQFIHIFFDHLIRITSVISSGITCFAAFVFIKSSTCKANVSSR